MLVGERWTQFVVHQHLEQLVPKEVCDLIWLGFLGMRGKFEPDELFIVESVKNVKSEFG